MEGMASLQICLRRISTIDVYVIRDICSHPFIAQPRVKPDLAVVATKQRAPEYYKDGPLLHFRFRQVVSKWIGHVTRHLCKERQSLPTILSDLRQVQFEQTGSSEMLGDALSYCDNVQLDRFLC